MKKQVLIISALAPLIALGLFLVQPVLAHDGGDQLYAQTQQDTQSKQATVNQAQKNANEQRDEIKKKIQAKRAELKQGICDKIKARVTTKHDHVKVITGEIASRIDQRVERAMSFVASKNLQVERDDTLLVDINTKKQAVTQARAAVIGAVASFDCNSDNRKVQEAAIREKVESYKVAIKAYKQSVKAFLQAVKSAAQTQLQSEPDNYNSSSNR